jgi:hypothetical protein
MLDGAQGVSPFLGRWTARAASRPGRFRVRKWLIGQGLGRVHGALYGDLNELHMVPA